MAITLSGDGITSDNITSLAASKLTGQVADANAPPGSVIQVLTSQLTTTVTNTGGAFADTGLTVTITPISSTSKFIIQWAIPAGNALATASVGFNLVRNGTNIAQGTSGSTNISTANNSGGSAHCGISAFCYLDSPATTSTLTYKVQVRAQGGTTGYINRTDQLSGGSDVYQAGYIANLIVMEISGS
jgi:hypothetical protein